LAKMNQTGGRSKGRREGGTRSKEFHVAPGERGLNVRRMTDLAEEA